MEGGRASRSRDTKEKERSSNYLMSRNAGPPSGLVSRKGSSPTGAAWCGDSRGSLNRRGTVERFRRK